MGHPEQAGELPRRISPECTKHGVAMSLKSPGKIAGKRSEMIT